MSAFDAGGVIARVSVHGQSLDQIMATAASMIDAIIESRLDDYEDVLRAGGATDEEVEIGLRRVHREVLQSRREFLARMCTGLLD